MSNSPTFTSNKPLGSDKPLDNLSGKEVDPYGYNSLGEKAKSEDHTFSSFNTLLKKRQGYLKYWISPAVNALLHTLTLLYTLIELSGTFLLRYSHKKLTHFNKLYLQRTVCFAVFIALSLFFYTFPEVDIWMSQPFYSISESTFFMKNDTWVQFIYVAFKQMPKFLLPIMLVIIVLSFKYQIMKQKRRLTVFALIVLILSPGLLVHTVFKDQWGRARPRNVEAFGGEKAFTPAWVISDQCQRNCSFVSGHAAMGFYFMILGWLLRSRHWLYVGIGIGILVGLTRIIQGGHFLSDTILSGFMVYWSIVFMAWVMNIPSSKEHDESSDASLKPSL